MNPSERPMHVAFATSDAYPALTPDDRLAAEACAARGIRVTPAVWDAPDLPWSAYDAVVIRSTWNYHRRPVEFDAWLGALAAAGIRSWNPVPLLRWNANKRYLAALASRGIATVPTAWLTPGGLPLADVMRQRGWLDAVVKPAISATAYGMRRVRAGDAQAAEAAMRESLGDVELLVQPFQREIESMGEWSLVFFRGAFSHSVRKRPTRGDFRVQTEFGGTSVAERAPRSVIDAGAAALRAVDGPWLYARVDGVETEQGFLLMELEMLEPLLFLALDAEAPGRFATALADALSEPLD